MVGNPGGRRVELFQAALRRLGLPPACTVAYTDLLTGRRVLPEVIRAGDIVRIESPGKDWAVEQALLAAGAEVVDDARFERLPREAIRRMRFDRGRILAGRQWYRGWCALLQTIASQLRQCAPHHLMLSPDDIAIMFDKPACHARLHAAGIAVPPSLGEVDCFDALAERMESSKWSRVFVKLAHGSSASGAVALETSRERMQAFSTVEVVESSDGLTLYNSRRLQTYRRPAEIAR
ncbi:MAG TPA: STM4014 family protein, partial [Herpetosiphonaceae bacterium]|nr:STM4014 family protein [Herpetosiphonaceae bacterium]